MNKIVLDENFIFMHVNPNEKIGFAMRVLALGDICGSIGRQAVKERIPYLKERLGIDFIIANGENSAGGVGITTSTINEILNAKIDCITGGNHSWKNREAYDKFDTEERVLRPQNYPAPAPGRGANIYILPDGRKIAVLNIQGTTFMDALPCPFQAAYDFVNSLDDDVIFRFVDFHAEATSEKKAMGFALDGKVSAVFGTHTHVQTADAQILPNGTAYMTDLGMCGVEQSCLGMSFESVLQRFITKRPASFKRAVGQGALNGLLMDLDDTTGKALSVSLFRENAPRTKATVIDLETDTAQPQEYNAENDAARE